MDYKSKFKGAEIDARLEKMVKVTYAELKALRDEGKLIAGQMYRMTDYETTCTSENAQVAGHPFDLVLTALDERTLDEKCSAIWSVRDTDGYFANSNLPAWDVRYCLDNDTERFDWSDANGKGVIYRLIDDAENSVPYDFKNIMFMRPLTEGKYDAENGVDTFCYTFCCIDWDTYAIEDQSVKEPNHCHNNKLAIDCYNNVFLTFFEDDCHSNTFGSYCYNNTFGSYCYDNTFGSNCQGNTLGDACSGNTFGFYCQRNTFGDDCYDNILGYYCYSNVLESECSENHFEKDCSDNYLGYYCNQNFLSFVYEIVLANSETASYDNAVQNYHISCVSEAEIQVYRNRNYDTYITTDKNGNIVEYTVDDIINK